MFEGSGNDSVSELNYKNFGMSAILKGKNKNINNKHRVLSSENPLPFSLVILSNFPISFEQLEKFKGEDPVLSPIISDLKQGKGVGDYHLSKNILVFKKKYSHSPKIVVPTSLIPLIFKYYHESNFGVHLGVYKPINKIRTYFTWKNLASDVSTRVRSCKICALSKPAQN